MVGGYVDCHCHMTAEEFAQDTADILERSRKAGVRALVSVTEHAGELESLLRLSERYPNYVMPCFGVHPIQSKAEGYRSVTLQDLEPVLEKFEKYKDHLVGIGEIGLDFTPWLTPTAKEREEQLKVFQMQLDIAKQLDLPVSVYSRPSANASSELSVTPTEVNWESREMSILVQLEDRRWLFLRNKVLRRFYCTISPVAPQLLWREHRPDISSPFPQQSQITIRKGISRPISSSPVNTLLV
ncbi:putative deoxyribonuclease tatdn3-A isoform X3 [Bufo bufo]|uniref:putative deoxyribonuclease tatdn3-A isoform X3 n=1 Tax=Bufo bufo TaxID=8384 RepID=UPI001ABDED0A|nr:putative deoxyribonuclease tatdn3-A isoform X3 [Bufo bufo]